MNRLLIFGEINAEILDMIVLLKRFVTNRLNTHKSSYFEQIYFNKPEKKAAFRLPSLSKIYGMIHLHLHHS